MITHLIFIYHPKNTWWQIWNKDLHRVHRYTADSFSNKPKFRLWLS